MTPRISLYYMPFQPVKISRQHKDKRSFTQHVMAGEARNDKGDNATSSPKSSVFDRLQPSTPHQRPSVFKRIERDKTPKLSVFQRLRGGKSPKPSVFTIIKTGGKFSSSSLAYGGNSMFSHLGEVTKSKAPSFHARSMFLPWM